MVVSNGSYAIVRNNLCSQTTFAKIYKFVTQIAIGIINKTCKIVTNTQFYFKSLKTAIQFYIEPRNNKQI